MKFDYEVGSSDIATFWYWINERHRIWVARSLGDKKPWTKDEILLDYKFTNAFRQLDTGTVALTDALENSTLDDADIVWNVLWYRLFNLSDHIENLGCIRRDDLETILAPYLRERRDSKQKVFTSAHMTTAAGMTTDKLDMYLRELSRHREWCGLIAEACDEFHSMEVAFNHLLKLHLVGRFIAYEIVCDLRFTRLLQRAEDKLTWANMGPGASRGLQRLGLLGRREDASGWPSRTSQGPRGSVGASRQQEGLKAMRGLYDQAVSDGWLGSHVRRHLAPETYPPFELREIEHSLCEFDKYERVRTGAGRPRQRYNGRS